MARDVVTELRVSGMRTVESVTLKPRGLCVFIGDNGTGKSTIIEACEILRKWGALGANFWDHFNADHGGFPAMGSDRLALGVRIEGNGPPLDYEFILGREGLQTRIVQERLLVGQGNEEFRPVILRTDVSTQYLDPQKNALVPFDISPDWPMLVALNAHPPFESIPRAVTALQKIEVHLPFDVVPLWANRSRNRRSEMRDSRTIAPATRLSLFAANLSNAYQALKNMPLAHWEETRHYLRLGLGEDFEDLAIEADPGGGNIALSVTFNPIGTIRLNQMPDGWLMFLGIVALFRLDDGRSLFAFDEPDLHLHPDLLMRVVGFLETMAKEHPVLVATHSDRFLDGLSEPAESALVCKLDEKWRTRIMKLDKDSLEKWMQTYRGLGDIRGAGYEKSVLASDGEC